MKGQIVMGEKEVERGVDVDAESARMTKHSECSQLVVQGRQCLARFLVQPSGTQFQLLLVVLPRPTRPGRLLHLRGPVTRHSVTPPLHPQPQLSRLFCGTEVSTRLLFCSSAKAVQLTPGCRMSRHSRPTTIHCPRILRVEWAESR